MAYSPLFGFNTTQKISLLAALDDAAAGTPASLTTPGTVKMAAAQATFAGADVGAINTSLNAFYRKLKNAGIVA